MNSTKRSETRKFSERDIEKILVAEVKRNGGKAYKFTSPGNDGVPDRIVIYPYCTPIFVELKTDVGRLSKLQKVQIKKLEELGQPVEVVKGVKGLEKFFRDYGYTASAERIRQKYLGGKDGI